MSRITARIPTVPARTPSTRSSAIICSAACATDSAERHEQSLIGIRGYCRQCQTEEIVAEIVGATNSAKTDDRR